MRHPIAVLVVLVIAVSATRAGGQSSVRGEERGRLRVDGAAFRDEAGAFWMWRGCTDFMAFDRFLRGEEIDGLLTERIQVGCRILRVLGMAHYIPANIGRPDLAPAAFGDRYWSGLAAFADKLADRGLRFEFVVFADAQLLMPSVKDQRAHLARVVSTLGPKWNVVGELVNEWSKNGVDPKEFEKPVGFPWSRGSALGGDLPFRPPWDWVSHHGQRGGRWYHDETARDIRDGFAPPNGAAYAGVKVPVIEDEPIGAAETAAPGRRDNVPAHFRWASALWAFTGGGTFHSDAGIASERYGPVQKACATAFFESLRTIPAEVQTWQPADDAAAEMPLAHRNQPSPTGAARTECRLSTAAAWCVAIDPGPSWRAEVRNGWRIAAQAGPRREIVRLER